MEFLETDSALKDLWGIKAHSTQKGVCLMLFRGFKSTSSGKTTVPAFHHLPSDTKLLNSSNIAEFVNTTYPNRLFTLSSPEGSSLEDRARKALTPVFRTSSTPRELLLLNPAWTAYF